MHPLIEIFPQIFLPTYLLIISLIFSTHIFWVLKRAKYFGFDRNKVLDVSIAVMLGSFLGARIFHVIWEDPEYYFEDLKRVLYFWQGGFVFYGGFLGAIFLGLFVLRKEKKHWFKWLDLFAPILASGYGLGRIACFFAGCCYGKPTDMPWCVRFPPGSEAQQDACLHPVQLYSTAWEFLVLVLLISLEKKSLRRADGRIFFVWLAFHAMGRFWQEMLRNDFRGPLAVGFSISMFISLLLFLFALFVLRVLKSRRG